MASTRVARQMGMAAASIATAITVSAAAASAPA